MRPFIGNFMRILILGMGLMGPTIAKDCCKDPLVTRVTGADIDMARLEESAKYVNNSKFDITKLSVLEHDSLVKAMKEYDLVIHGTASRFSMNALKAAMEAKVNIVDLAGGGYPQEGEIYEEVKKAGITAMPGCGVDPGLIDVLSGQAVESDTTCITPIRM